MKQQIKDENNRFPTNKQEETEGKDQTQPSINEKRSVEYQIPPSENNGEDRIPLRAVKSDDCFKDKTPFEKNNLTKEPSRFLTRKIHYHTRKRSRTLHKTLATAYRKNECGTESNASVNNNAANPQSTSRRITWGCPKASVYMFIMFWR